MGNKPLRHFLTQILITLFLFGSMFFSASARAEEHNWAFLGEIEGDLWFVDTDSITCKENICRAWVKMLSRTAVKKISIDKEEYTKSLHEYNCTWREYRILQTTKYDPHGNAITTTSPTESVKKHKVPEAISNTLYDLVCKKTTQQKEQQDSDKKYHEKVNEELQKDTVATESTAKTEESAKQPPTKQPPSQVKSVPEKVVSAGTIEKVKKESKKKSPRLQQPSETTFTVQVGSFKNPAYAKSLKAMLSKKGYTTFITASRSANGGRLHKVRIGKFSDRKKAESLSEEIKKTEGLQAFVTPW